MKQVLPFIIAGLILFSFKTDSSKNSLDLSNLKGKVHVVVESTYAPQPKGAPGEKGKLSYLDSSTYNEQGNILQWKHYDANGVLQSANTNTYNDADYKTAETGNIDNKPFKDTTLYNKDGKAVEQDMFNQKGRLASKLTYKYEGDNMTEEDIYVHNKITAKHTYSYNDNGIIFLQTNYKSGGVTDKIAFSHDDHGDVTKIETYDPHGKLKTTTKMQYNDYDKTGNWISCTKLYNDKPVGVVEREIHYY